MFHIKYSLEFTVRLVDEFIKNREVDPRKYARIRNALCKWIQNRHYCSNNGYLPRKSAKVYHAKLSTALNRLDDYYLDAINYMELWSERNRQLGGLK